MYLVREGNRLLGPYLYTTKEEQLYKCKERNYNDDIVRDRIAINRWKWDGRIPRQYLKVLVE